MRIWKYHGLGNDFLILDAPLCRAEDAIALCDRRRGLGADGVLWHRPSEDAAAEMIIFNADGSRPQMCGNGLRCFVRWLVEQGRAELGEVPVRTDAGLRTSRLTTPPREPGEAGAVEVQVDMGRARFDRESVPMKGEGESIEVLEVEGRSLRLRGVSMGNPHAVVQVKGDTLEAARTLGDSLSHHSLFPEQCNAGFAHLRSDDSVSLTVWERGCGITQACGTGAAAAVAALSRDFPRLLGKEVAVDLPGGRLIIVVPSDPDAGVSMQGAAVRLFEVEVEPWWRASR